MDITGIKPCPICGQVDRLNMTNEESYKWCFNENLKEHNLASACIIIRCYRCGLQLGEYSDGFTINQYKEQKDLLITKWNNMPRKENEDDGK